MPWKEVSAMSLRKEFVMLAARQEVNVSELCRRFGISRKTGYKWLIRHKLEGDTGLSDIPRRPHNSPKQTQQAVESLVLSLRDEHPAWGGRKIKRRLEDMGNHGLPAPSTITQILRRRQRLDPAESAKHTPWRRFEHDAPNRLWQMDFKGHFAMQAGRCHPLTVIDDHSRYSLCLDACLDERAETVRERLTLVFRRYGLPERMTMDNGSPWGSDTEHPYTVLTIWLIRIGIKVGHSRPYHPQTQGKDERFHRTLKTELLRWESMRSADYSQRRFNEWRHIYNTQRPHEGIGMSTPASRYVPSPRSFPEILPPIEYGPGDIVRKVNHSKIYYRGAAFNVGKAFHGQPVALRATSEDGALEVYFCNQRIAKIDLRNP